MTETIAIIFIALFVLSVFQTRKAQKNCQNALEGWLRSQKGWDDALELNKQLLSMNRKTTMTPQNVNENRH